MTNFLSFLIFFNLSARIAVIELFFSDNPRLGTLVSAVASSLLLLLIFINFIFSPHYLRVKVLKPLPVQFVSFFVIWSGLSVIWSQANSKVESLGYWFYLILANFLMVIFLFKQNNTKDISVTSLKGFVIGTAIVAIVAIFTWEAGDRIGSTKFLHPNSIGNYLGIGSLLAIFLTITKIDIKRCKVLWAIISVFLLSVFFMALSKTSMLAFAVASPFVFAFSNLTKKVKITTFFSLVIIVAIFASRIQNHITLYVEKENYGRNIVSTLSGRTLLWEQVKLKIEDSPWIGHGVMSFRDVFVVPHAHNEFLTVWFSYGVVGVIIVVSVYFSFIVYLLRNKRSDDESNDVAMLAFAIFVFEMIRGLTESDSASFVYPFMFILIFCYWIISYREN